MTDRELPADHESRWLYGETERRQLSIELTPMKAIRAKCLDCAGGKPAEVTKCHITDCTLYPYRFGTRPHYQGHERKKRELTQEQLDALRERLHAGKMARKARN